MKKPFKLIVILFVVVLGVSACTAKTITPPATATPTETVAPTETATDTTTEPTPAPTADTRLSDDEGKMICTISQGFFPELTEEQEAMLSVFPAITEDDWSKGPEDALLTILEYSDFQCPACVGFYDELNKLMEKYPDDIRLVFRHLPLESLHPNSILAAQAAEAAGLQGKFWEMYDALFSQQSSWATLTSEEFTSWLENEAATLGLDVDQFMADLTSEAIVTKIQQQMDYNFNTIGLSATPTILLNGRPWSYDWSASTLGMVIEVLKYEKQGLYTECPPWVIDQNKEYTATIKTEKGDIVVELYPKEAPLTVNAFVFLARAGFYDGITFHRVAHDFVAQAGDPSGTGISGPGFEYRNEISDTLNFDEAYMVGMANAGPDTNGSQFFITYVPATQLSGSYTIFGKVISGFDVLEKLTERDTQVNPDAPAGDKIITIEIDEK